MMGQLEFVVFRLDGQRFALPIGVAERFVRAVEVTPLPGAPPIALGAINVGGTVVPVLSLRLRFGHPDRPVRISDQFLIARTPTRPVALVVDEALSVMTVPPEAVSAASTVVPGLEHLRGVVTLDDGIVLIHDLETCLSLDEERAVTRALRQSVESHA